MGTFPGAMARDSRGSRVWSNMKSHTGFPYDKDSSVKLHAQSRVRQRNVFS